MTPAEYRTFREQCGLSQDGAAEFHNVRRRTIQHWEAGRNGIRDGAAKEIVALSDRIDQAVAAIVAEWRKHRDIDAVRLYRYQSAETYAGSRPDREGLSWSSHNALIGRALLALRRLGAVVTVEWG